jgi:hypothetical protein
VEAERWIALLLYGVTAVSSGFNARYFWRYRTARRGRRMAALALALVQGAVFLENGYFAGLFVRSGSFVVALAPGPWLFLRAALAVSSLAITVLVLRSGARAPGR